MIRRPIDTLAQHMTWYVAFVTFLLIPCISEGQVDDDDRQIPASSSTTSQPSGESTEADSNVEVDKAAIETVWRSFQAALSANDIELAGRHFAPYAGERYVQLLEQMGSQMSKMADNWSEFTPIRIGDEVAVYALIQKEGKGDRLHSVTFVRYPGYGWLIHSY